MSAPQVLGDARVFVRIELRTDDGQTLAAEISQVHFDTMHLETGSKVFVRPRHIRVFAGSGA
jgi:hypothetical protein